MQGWGGGGWRISPESTVTASLQASLPPFTCSLAIASYLVCPSHSLVTSNAPYHSKSSLFKIHIDQVFPLLRKLRGSLLLWEAFMDGQLLTSPASSVIELPQPVSCQPDLSAISWTFPVLDGVESLLPGRAGILFHYVLCKCFETKGPNIPHVQGGLMGAVHWLYSLTSALLCFWCCFYIKWRSLGREAILLANTYCLARA